MKTKEIRQHKRYIYIYIYIYIYKLFYFQHASFSNLHIKKIIRLFFNFRLY